MLPTSPTNNLFDRFGGDAITLCRKPMIMAALPADRTDYEHLGGGEFSRRTAFAVRGTAFGNHVPQVFLLSSVEKVRRVAAWFPVAGMTYKERGPIATGKKERNTVSIESTYVPIFLLGIRTVSADDPASPSPAISLWPLTGSFINAIPKLSNFLRGELRRVYSNFSHVSLLVRSEWLGSSDCFRSPAGRLYFSTAGGRIDA